MGSKTKNIWDSIALNYENNVLSPLSAKVQNPLFGCLNSLERAKYKRVADFGCGPGALLSFLAMPFEEVVAIDSSPVMIEKAKESHKEKNIQYALMDMCNLKAIRSSIDIGIAVNSMASSSIKENQNMVNEISRSLRPGGLFVAIFPSFDTVVYLRQLTSDSLLAAGQTKSETDYIIHKEFDIKFKMDIEKGLYADDTIHVQKLYTPSEISALIGKSGLRNFSELEKVLYPWEITRRYQYGYFPGKPKIWDWFIVAIKD